MQQMQQQQGRVPRVPGQPLSLQQQQQMQQQQQQRAFAQRAAPTAATATPQRPVSQAPKRKRPTDKILPKKLEEYVPEAKLYHQLHEFEKKLDATMTRKILDLQDSLLKPTPVKRTLRVFFSNLSSNQFAADEDSNGMLLDNTDLSSSSLDLLKANIPSWTLKIQARLLDLPNTRKAPTNPPRFSNFIKKVIVELKRDEVLYPEGNVIEWNKRPGEAEFDGFEIKRRGDGDVPVKVMLFLDSHPDKFKLSPGLSRLLDIHSDTLPNVLFALWQYVKTNRLQDPEEKRGIICDEPLKALFGHPKIMFSHFPELLHRHLFPSDPITLEYTVRVDKDVNVGPVAYDLDVELDNPLRDRIKMITQKNSAAQRDINALDEQISAVVQALHSSKLKKDFMTSFVEDPVGFLNKWVSSQSKDLEVVLGDGGVNPEDARRSEFYQQDRIKEALYNYMSEREMH